MIRYRVLCCGLLLSASNFSSSRSVAPQRFFSEMITSLAYYFLGDVRAEYAGYPYEEVQASIRQSYDISDQEKSYIAQRASSTQQSLATFLGRNDLAGKGVNIALCCSGGGYRAMLTALGAMKGAEEIGLYDTALYAAGVSGGAWSIAVMSQCGNSAATCLEAISAAIDESLLDDFNHAQVEQALIKQIAFSKRCSLIDFYGALLAQKLLRQPDGSNPCGITIDQQATTLVPTKQLFPIYSTVFDAGNNNYEWVEFNPYEVSCVALGSAIPSWAFGRSFKAGSSTQSLPAESLGYCMGIWGSSFTADLKDIASNYLPDLSSYWLSSILGRVVADMPELLSDARAVTPAQVDNWNYATELRYAQRSELSLMDAGFMCDLPLLPLLRKARGINLIIIIDASLESDTSELHIAEQYARQHTILFPPIDYTQLSLPCSVHADWSNPATPVIIYFPLVAQVGYCNGWDPAQADFTSTFNFSYTKEQALLLAGLMEYSIVQNRQIVLDTINRMLSNNIS